MKTVVNIRTGEITTGVPYTEAELSAMAQIDAEPMIPQSVTMAQARKALVLNGVTMADVDNAINAIANATTRELAQIDWEYSPTVNRGSALVASIASSLGLTDAEVDALFIEAASL